MLKDSKRNNWIIFKDIIACDLLKNIVPNASGEGLWISLRKWTVLQGNIAKAFKSDFSHWSIACREIIAPLAAAGGADAQKPPLLTQFSSFFTSQGPLLWRRSILLVKSNFLNDFLRVVLSLFSGLSLPELTLQETTEKLFTIVGCFAYSGVYINGIM